MNISSPSEPTVFLVDDDPDALYALQVIVADMGHRTAAFSSPRDFQASYQAAYRGCLILDVRMPRQSGLELYRTLLREGKRLPVIFVTGDAQVRVAVAAMKLGAVEFLEKPVEPQSLRSSIQRALELDCEWREREAAFNQIDFKIAKLTSRERETLELIVVGQSNKAMAEQLFISERAVEMRRSKMIRKLGVSSTAELLDLAITHRVVSELRDVPEQHS